VSLKTILSPTLYVFNSASLVKPNAIEQLTVELMGYDVDIAVISESHLKRDMQIAVLISAVTHCFGAIELDVREAVLRSTFVIRRQL